MVGEGEAGVAIDASALAGEEAKAIDLRGRQRGRFAGNPPVEARRRGDQRALVGGERPGDVVDGDRWVLRERLGKGVRVALMAGEASHGGFESGAHLVGMLDGEADLIFEARRASVPKEERAPGHVPQRGRVAHQAPAGNAAARRLPVGEAELRVVAGGTGDRASGGKLPVFEQALAERDLGGGREVAGGIGDEGRPGELGLQRGEVVAGRLGACCLGRCPERQRDDQSESQRDARCECGPFNEPRSGFLPWPLQYLNLKTHSTGFPSP